MSTNKSIANFEAFYWNISFSRNILLMKNAYLARPLALSRDFGSKTQNRCMYCIHITILIKKLQYTFFTGDVKKKWKSSLRQQQIIFENNSNHYNLETAFPDEFTDHYMFEVRRIREIL